MNGVFICKSIIETIKTLINSDDFLAAHRIGNAFTRKRQLDFLTLFYFLINISKKSIPIRIADFMDDFPSLAFPNVSKQAISKARQGISVQAFIEIYQICVQKFYELRNNLCTWHSFNVFAIDGTSLQIPQTKRNIEEFGEAINQSGTSCAMASVSTIYDVINDITVDACIVPYNYGERKLALEHINKLKRITVIDKAVIILDRGYPSYDMFKEFYEKELFFVIRVSNSFSSITNFDGTDSIINYSIKNKPTIPLRALHITLPDGTIETLATNIMEPQITLEMFKELYFLRWGIECKYYEFKECLEIEEFTGSHPNSIRQDFFIHMLLSNLASILKNDVDEEIIAENKYKKNKYNYQANRNFLISRVVKYIVKMIVNIENIMEYLQQILFQAKRVRSQFQPNRKYKRKKKKKRKHYNNRKSCL